ncbi:MAG: DUF1573 domain-containing protein, partial [Clostridia bacterium]|nr:DUF1573 domain-containing protein [Clostridia bacterium]
KSNNTKLGTVTATVAGQEGEFKSGTAIEAGKEVTIIIHSSRDAYFDGLYHGNTKLPSEPDGTIKFTTTDAATTLTAKFVAMKPEPAPPKYDVTLEGNVSKTKDSITIKTGPGYIYLVSSEKKVTLKTQGWKQGADTNVNEGKVTFDGLKPGTDYFVYWAQTGHYDGNPPTKNSAPSKRSDAVRTLASTEIQVDTIKETIYGVIGTKTPGKAEYMFTNTGSEPVKITDATIVDADEATDAAYFKTDFKKAITVKAGETKSIYVMVSDEKAIENTEEKSFQAKVRFSFDQEDLDPVETEVQYEARKEMWVSSNPTDFEDGMKIVTYTGKPIPYNTKKVLLESADDSALNRSNLKVAYRMIAPVKSELTTVAPKEVGVYEISFIYEDAKNSAYVGEDKFFYIIRAQKPKAPVVTVRSSFLAEFPVEAGQVYYFDDLEEESWLETGANGTSASIFLIPGTLSTITTYVPEVENDLTGCTASERVSKTVKAPKTSKATITKPEGMVFVGSTFDRSNWIEGMTLKCGKYSVGNIGEIDVKSTILTELINENECVITAQINGEEFRSDVHPDSDNYLENAFKENVGTAKVTYTILADNPCGIAPTSTSCTIYVRKHELSVTAKSGWSSEKTWYGTPPTLMDAVDVTGVVEGVEPKFIVEYKVAGADDSTYSKDIEAVSTLEEENCVIRVRLDPKDPQYTTSSEAVVLEFRYFRYI